MKQKLFYFGSLFLGITLLSTLASCKKDIPQEVIGVVSFKFTPVSGTKSYTCEVSQAKSTIENSKDSVPSNTPSVALKMVKLSCTTTIGAKAYVGINAITTETVVDATKPINIIVKKDGVTPKIYTLNVLVAKNDASAKEGLKVASDMTANGLPKGVHDFDMTFFNGKFYAMISKYSADFSQSFYEMFTSQNGENWTKINTEPNSIGGQGARFCIFNNRLYALGGGRFWGTDENGVKPEETYSMGAINFWRSWSTADGNTWKVDTIGVQSEKYIRWDGKEATRLKKPIPLAYASTLSFNNKMYIKGGKSILYGQGQTSRVYYSTPDGTNWTQLEVTNPKADNIVNRTDEAFFVFKNKMWIIGGFRNYLQNADNLFSDVWSSTDGLTWTKEADETIIGKIYGAKVVASGDVVYLFGGETINENKERVLSNKVYRSTDCKTWTEVKMATGFVARRNAPIVLDGSTAWIFGGWGISTGNYAFTEKTKDVQILDTWTKSIQ